MQSPDIKKLQTGISYQFNDESLLRLALTHRSFSSENNERLEFLGDALLGVIIAEKLFHKFPGVKEGVLSRQRSKLVKGETLAEIARGYSVGDYLILGSGELKSGGYRRDSILANTLEAIIGAIFLDSDNITCKHVVLGWYESRLQSLSAGDTLKDSKTQLQELLQSKKLPLPEYTIVETSGASHNQQFTVNCSVTLLEEPMQAIASSRRQAEKDAAVLVLEALRKQVI